MGERRRVSLGFSEEMHEEGDHIVYLYNNDSEKKRTMARFLQEGLHADEKVLYLVHDIPPEEMLGELRQLGVDMDSAGKAFDMLTAHYTHCPGGIFSKDYMLDVVGAYYDDAIQDGFSGARGAGEMSWAAEGGHAELRDLLEYESRLNSILADHPLTTVCQYDVRLFSGQLILDILRVHPLAVVGGQLVKNPYYIVPDRFLDELDHRIPTA